MSLVAYASVHIQPGGIAIRVIAARLGVVWGGGGMQDEVGPC